jgi:hypothetical protein
LASLTVQGQPSPAYSLNVPPSTTVIVFDTVAPAAYNVLVQSIAADGTVLAQKTDTVTVSPPPPVNYSVPGSISEVVS